MPIIKRTIADRNNRRLLDACAVIGGQHLANVPTLTLAVHLADLPSKHAVKEQRQV